MTETSDNDDSRTHPQDVSTMTIAELKSELLSMNNPSFVFSNRNELESALRSARRLEEQKLKSLGSIGRRQYSEDDIPIHALDMSEVTGMSSEVGSESFIDADEPIPTPSPSTHEQEEVVGQVDTADDANVANENEISRRLVEYFVMVSSVPIMSEKDGKPKILKSRRKNRAPPDPSRDRMNSRTAARFEVRRSHLLSNASSAAPAVEENIPTIKESDAKDETASTTSTSSTIEEPAQAPSKPGATPGSTKLKPSNSMTFQIPQDVSHPPPGSRPMDDHTEDYLLEPMITARYPAVDHPDQPLNPRLPQFCHPEGTDFIHPTKEYKMPRIHFFVLTDNAGGKQYGTCMTVYEEFRVNEEEEENEGAKAKKTTYYAPRVLCLLSTYPYLTSFRTYLTQLYRLATTTNVMTAPIERYVQNICFEVPAPPPGAFEVQLKILGSNVRFWAPPADQPIAYVSLPFKVLFECLDIGNILFAWYTLACERKLLLVSGQLSLLTVCAEILCSLLFPMKWSHLYIPVLPRSLSPMLDAPMPYLCGISRENFPYAVADISDETVVVDLDRNVITLGPEMPDLPPLPHKRRLKLENALKANCGEVFWEARNLDKSEVLKVRSAGDDAALSSLLRKAGSVWDERIRTRDDAFNLAYLPDSTTLEFSDDANCDAENGMPKQSRWDAVQEAFLRFYVAMLQDYRKFMPTENVDKRSSWRGKDGVSDARFRIEEFVQASSAEFRPFLEELTMTQQFDDFVTKRMFDAKKAPDVIFFDQSIEAKKNRSRRKFKKVDTPFLHSASAHRDLKRVQAVEPTCEGLPPLPKGEKYSPYKTWPVAFDEALFGTPRPIPKIISAEFDRQSALRAMFRGHAGGDGGQNKSPEATTFILFFLTFTKVIGKEFSKVEAKHDGTISHRTLVNLDDDMSVAHIQAKAQIDLAYHTLSLMRARKLPPEPTVYKLLIQACGNAKVTHRAPELMEMLARDGLATNSEIYTSLIAAFSSGSEAGPSALAMIYGGDNVSDISSSHGGSYLPLMEATSEHGSMVSDLTPPGSIASTSTKNRVKQAMKSSLSNRKMNPFKKNASSKRITSSSILTKKSHMRVNSAIAKHIELGESLIDSLYPGIVMDTESDACPKCAKTVSEDQIIMGWTPCASKEYETQCPSCKHKFVPKFCITCNSPTFEGSQGKGSPLYCDYLSPWVLLREMKGILSKAGIETVLDERFRSGSGMNSTLWWNMVITFRRYKLPYIFLLQGSFKNQLILPSPGLNDDPEV